MNAPRLSPPTELLVAALQFLNAGEAARARLRDALAALPEPEAAEAGPTLLRLRQVSAIALKAEGFRGLIRVALDRALRAHCFTLRAVA